MRSHAALLAVAFALLLVTPTATAALQDAPAADEPRVHLDVHLAADGDARWSVSMRFPLNSTNDTRAFERLAEEYEAGGDVGFSAAEFREVARAVADETGRDMAITRVNRTAYVEGNATNGTGVIALEFTWTEFARVEGDRVIVGDAFAGGWLDRLSENQVLRFHAPEGYGVETALAGVENATAIWTGPHEFNSGQPRVVFLEGAVPPGDTTTPGTSRPAEEAGMVLLVLVALLAGGLVVWGWTHQRADDAGAAVDAVPDAEPASADDAEPVEPPSAEPDDPDDADDVDDDVDPELLSDEERVERLLRRNGGRMKQGDIVSETGWSNAKVSQLLSSMADEERVEKLRIGRENLITLADESVEGGPD